MIAIDTHIWIFLISGTLSSISPKALKRIHKSKKLYLNAISFWEVALLETKGRLVLDRTLDQWIANAKKYPKLEIVNLDPTILIESVKLENFHSDPADRMITAMCLLNNWPLVTRDKQIQNYKLIETIW